MLGERKSHGDYRGGGCLQIKNYEAKKKYICIYVYIYTICIFFLIKDFFKGKDNNKREYIEKLFINP